MTVDQATWTRRTLAVVLGFLALRLLVLALGPLDLSSDEAYYWDWSRAPAWCYYSKPPMIAWINWLSSTLLGSATWTVRLPAALLTAFGAWGLYLLTARMYDARTAFWAVLLAHGTVAYLALGMFMTIDAPLAACWTWALYGLWRAVEAKRLDWLGWAIVAVAVLLGTWSKQIMVVFPCVMVFYLAVCGSRRRHLRHPGPWLVVMTAIAAWVPIVWWNSHNDWIMFGHTAGHVEGAEFSALKVLDHMGVYQLIQLLLATPVTYVLLLILLVVSLRRIRTQPPAERLALIFCGGPLLVMIILSVKQAVNPNWPLVFYTAGLPLLAAWCTGRAMGPTWLDRYRSRLARAAAIVGLVMVGIGYLYLLAFRPLGLAGTKLDLASRTTGWQTVATDIDAVLATVPNRERTFVVARDRKETAELAFYLPGQPRTYRWKVAPQVVDSQYDVWPGPTDKLGWDALIVYRSKEELHEGLIACFESVDDLGIVESVNDRTYHLYLGRNLQRWIDDPLPPPDAVTPDAPTSDPTPPPAQPTDTQMHDTAPPEGV